MMSDAPLPDDPVRQASALALMRLMREQSMIERADRQGMAILKGLATHPWIALALFASEPDILGEAGWALMSSPAYLAPLDVRSHLRVYSPAACQCAAEAMLDCPDEALARGLWSALPKPAPAGMIAMAIRRSFDPESAAARLARADRVGLLSAPLLRLLASHSSWCDNGVAGMAQALVDQRALSRSGAKAAKAPSRKTRI